MNRKTIPLSGFPTPIRWACCVLAGQFVFLSAIRADTYHWTGAGNAVGLFDKNNWGLDGDSSKPIPRIRPKVPVRHDLLIPKGTTDHVGGGGFRPDLVMGGAKLVVAGGRLKGGTWTPKGGAGIWNDWHADGKRSPMVVSGGEVLVGFLADIACELSGDGELTLRHPEEPLKNSTRSDLSGCQPDAVGRPVRARREGRAIRRAPLFGRKELP